MQLLNFRRNLKNSLIFLHISLAIVGLYIFFYNFSLSENLITDKTLAKQSVLSRAGAKSIENFINNIESQLHTYVFSFSRTNESDQIDITNSRFEFQQYIRKTKSPIIDIALYDETGKLLIIENKENKRTGEGEDFSDRDFIIWSKNPLNKDRIFISSPYTAKAGSSIGRTIIAFATPNYFGTKLKGTLSIRVSVSQFQDNFISPLNPGLDESAIIVSSDGVLIAGNNDLYNKNLISYAKEKKWKGYEDFIDKVQQALSKGETETIWSFQNPREIKPKQLLVSSSKIDIPDTEKDLFLIVTSSKDSISSSLNNLRFYGIAWLGFGLFTTILGGVLIIFLKIPEEK